MVQIKKLCEGVAYALIKQSDAKPWCVLTATVATLPVLQNRERLDEVLRVLNDTVEDLTVYEVYELQTHEGYPKCPEGKCVLDWITFEGSGTARYIGRKTLRCPKLIRNLFYAHIGKPRARRAKFQILTGPRTRKPS